MTQKKDNKGFSLVELIVVVAIMAVLMGILVPTLVRNVEKSKRQKDLSGIEEVRSTMQVALADEDFSDITTTVTFSSGELKISTMSPATGTVDANIWEKYRAEVSSQIKDYKCKSKAYRNATITITIKDESVYFEITGSSDSKYNTKSENYPSSSNNG